MPETLLTPSSIKLFGRIMTSLQLVRNMHPGPSHNNFLERQINAEDAILARIYAFSFEGAFYEIPKPPIFVVHGEGTPVGNWDIPSTMDQTGVAGRDWDFSGNNPHYHPNPAARVAGGAGQPAAPPAAAPPPPNDIHYWEYEKGDFSLRFDIEAGPFDQILLQMALRGGGGVSGAGVSGAGVSGAGVSGAGVSGAGVSGAGVSGAGVSGAGVSGAGVRR
jgi:hypothetical protein